MKITLPSLLVLSLSLGAATAQAGAAPSDLLAQVRAATQEAQTACYRQIHHDTDDFEDCLKAMLKKERKPTARRLGIAYFGFVGALNSARMGMAGAADMATGFLPVFRATQKKLGIDDDQLCATIPGDCVVRIARMKQMEAVPAPKSGRAARTDTHAH